MRRLPETHAWIENDIGDVGQELRHHGDEDSDERCRLQDLNVAEHGSIEERAAKAGILEKYLDHDHLGQEPLSWRKISVTGTISAFLRACLRMTRRYGSPFRTAVRTYWEAMTSAIDARVILVT